MRGRGRPHKKPSYNPPPTPSMDYRRDSDASFASSRPSSASGVGRSVIPIKDRTYQQSAIRTINAYLNSHNFHPTLKPTSLPSAKDITSIFTFLVSQFDYPNPKFEEDLPPLLEFLSYPHQIPKSAFRTPATPHAWPNFLAAMHWLVQLLLYTHHASSSATTSSVDKRNIMKEYELESYLHYIRGEDDHVEALDQDFLRRLGTDRDAMAESVNELEKSAAEIEARLEALRKEPSLREVKEKEKRMLEQDVNKFNTLIEEFTARNETLRKGLEEKEKELRTKEEEKRMICEENEELKKTVHSQTFNARDAERMKRELQAVEREIADAETERNKYEDLCWELDVQLGRKFKELEELAKECNKAIQKLKLGTEFQYMLNAKGSTPAEVLGINYKSTLKPALVFHENNIKKSSMEKLDEKIVLQQQSKENAVKIEEKNSRILALQTRIEELEAELNLLKKEAEEYIHRCTMEASKIVEDVQKETNDLNIAEREAEELLMMSKQKLQETERECEEEIQRCAYELFTLVDGVSKFKEQVENKISQMKSSLSETADYISEAFRAALPVHIEQSFPSSK